MKVSAEVSKVVLKLVPDFGLFNQTDYLLKDLAVMWQDLRGALQAMASRVAVLLAIGLVAMWRGDFGT